MRPSLGEDHVDGLLHVEVLSVHPQAHTGHVLPHQRVEVRPGPCDVLGPPGDAPQRHLERRGEGDQEQRSGADGLAEALEAGPAHHHVVDDGHDAGGEEAVGEQAQVAVPQVQLALGLGVVVRGRGAVARDDEVLDRGALEVVADGVGASLRWSTVEVRRNERRNLSGAPWDDEPLADDEVPS